MNFISFTVQSEYDTELMKAAEGGHLECMRLLYEAGADVNCCDSVLFR